MVDIEVLKQLGTVKMVAGNAYVFKEGDPGSEMFIVLSGKVEVLYEPQGGFPVKIAEMGPGEFFGEMSLLEDMPRSASIRAVKDAILLSIDKNNFLRFIARQPALAYKIMKGLSARVRSLNEEIACLRKSSPGPDKAGNSCPTEEPRQTTAVFCESLFPEGHKSYGLKAPESHNEYLFDKQVKCPVCGKTFKTRMPKMSKLKLDRMDHDFRKHYADFEPLWYSIWVCPGCLYGSFNSDFESLNYKYAKAVASKITELEGKVVYNPEGPIDIDRVFTAYYLALFCANAYPAPPLKLAKLWLQLSWLYRDCGDEEMASMASLKALENYRNAYYNSNLNISTEEEQQLCIILGELFLLKGDVNEAGKHFHKAINRKIGSAALNQQAQDRIYDLKEIIAGQE